MSYMIRNSIVLGVLLVVVLLAGTYLRAFRLPTEEAEIAGRVKQIDEELQNTPNLVHQFNELSATLADTRKRWDTRDKDIPPADITSETYAHFSHLMDLSGEVKLDMLYAGMQQRGNFGYNVYNLKGEAPFESFYKFLWHLENGRKLYKVQGLTAKGIEIAPSDNEEGRLLVAFQANVHAYFTSVPELATSVGERTGSPDYLYVDPFEPVIASGIAPNVRDLVEIERSDLKAVIPGKAFVLDQTSAIRALEEGDEVYLGYITRIVADEGRLEATLNKGGIIEKVVLTIRYGPSQGGPQQVQQVNK
ncbi:MAG: hypothetical protein WB626_13165 [Bacteroidota bacterium]